MPSQNVLSEVAPLIHQAALDPYLSIESLNNICDASRHFGFSGICTDLTRVTTARERLGPPNKTKLIAVIAFPFGFIPNIHKQAQAEWAAEKGADELDVVPNFLALIEGDINLFAAELATICETGLPVRAILNLASLSSKDLSIAVEAAIDAGVHGIQTGNGFGRKVNESDIHQLCDLTKGRCEIKAAGGIKKLDQAMQLVEAGATKIGTTVGSQLIQDLKTLEQ